MKERSLRLGVSGSLTDFAERYRQLAEKLERLGHTIVSVEEPYDVALMCDTDQLAGKLVEQRLTLRLYDKAASGNVDDNRYAIFADDSENRLAHVLSVTCTEAGTERSGDLPESSFGGVITAEIVNTLSQNSMQSHFAMMVAIERLALMNTRHGRDVVNDTLAKLQQKIRSLVSDALGELASVTRHSVGFLILSKAVQNRRQWQLIAEEIVTIVRDIRSGENGEMLLSANISLASVKRDEAPENYARRMVAALEAVQHDASAHVKWADRGTDLASDYGSTLERELADAISNGDIIIRYQPQFSISDGHLVGAEALARWQHSSMGELGASILFGVARRAGLMQPLSHHIQTQALLEAAKWPNAISNLRLSVNISAQDLAAPDFTTRFAKTVAESTFDPERLTVEVTETDLISELDRAARLCAVLRSNKIRIAIDDFGTGFSSLLYLKSLPVDYLKLDGAMSADIGGSPRDRVIVRSIIALGTALNLTIIAEGVETEEQRSLLSEEGCDLYQGFLGGKAMDSDAFVKFALRAN